MDILKESAPKKAVIGKSKRYRVIIKYKVLRGGNLYQDSSFISLFIYVDTNHSRCNFSR